jgi:DNA modification methylase
MSDTLSTTAGGNRVLTGDCLSHLAALPEASVNLAVAKRLGRRYLGIELSGEYAERIRRRLAEIGEPTGSFAREVQP